MVHTYQSKTTSKKVFGKMKDDERYGEVMIKMVGLRSKTYATDIDRDEHRDKRLAVKMSKGVKLSML